MDPSTGQRPQHHALLPPYRELKPLLEIVNFSSLSRSFGTGKHALWQRSDDSQVVSFVLNAVWTHFFSNSAAAKTVGNFLAARCLSGTTFNSLFAASLKGKQK